MSEAEPSAGSTSPPPPEVLEEDPFVLGVDIDGVLADYTYAFSLAVAKEKGIDHETLPTQTRWDFGQWGIESREEYEALHQRAVTEHRIFANCPVIHGAAEALWRLSDAGIWIRIITHRLPQNWGHAIAVSDTVQWLDDNGIPYRDLCFLGRKPEVEADLYIDDAPHNVEGLRRRGNRVIIFDQPYNQDLEGLRAGSWSEAEDIIAAQAVAAGSSIQTGLAGLDEASTRLATKLDRSRRDQS